MAFNTNGSCIVSITGSLMRVIVHNSSTGDILRQGHIESGTTIDKGLPKNIVMTDSGRVFV